MKCSMCHGKKVIYQGNSEDFTIEVCECSKL